MNELELVILNELKYHHRGKDNSITYKDLAFYEDINSRELRQIVSGLVTEYHQPIASSSDCGYYWLENETEFIEAHRELISRIKKLSKRAKGLRLGYSEYKNSEVKQLQLIC